jgi:dienelactone hydrolase
MPFALLARVGLVGVVCALSLACSLEDGDTMEAPETTAGSGGSSAGTSAGGGSSSAGTSSGTAGSTTTAGTSSGGMSGSGGGGAGGMSGSGGSGGAAIDPNGGAPAGPASGRHTARPIGSKGGNTAGYWEYLPPYYGNGARYPLLVFRHGIGENGNGTSELPKVIAHGPPKLIEADQWPEDRKFIVLSVQHTGDGCAPPQETDDFFKFAFANYDVDPTRVYLTGLSCGSIGSWDYLGEHTNETVAAAVLICGNGRPAFAKAGCNLGKVPIWAFHGEADPTVDPKGSTEAIASLKACTSPTAIDARLTTYPGVGHDSWTMTYNLSNPANDIYAWLMSHQKL